MKIFLTSDEIAQCIDFSHKSARSQQQVEFGQHDTLQRTFKEIARDNCIGKLAEVAFSKMMKQHFDLDIPLDFNIYPRGVWDDADANINGWRIDIKSTRPGARWMLIEWNKLNFRQTERKPTHVFVMAVTDWDRQNDTPTGGVEFVGFVSRRRLKVGIPGTHVIRKGEYLPGKNVRLQADNFGIRFSDLDTDWKFMVSKLLERTPAENTPTGHKNIWSRFFSWLARIFKP